MATDTTSAVQSLLLAEQWNRRTQSTPPAVAPTYDQVIAAWNAQADEHNQWDALGEDEKIEWAVACAKAAPAAQGDAEDAARWRWLSSHIMVAWNEGRFTSLVRIVSDENRASLNASVDRMMGGDWSDVDAARSQAKEGGA